MATEYLRGRRRGSGPSDHSFTSGAMGLTSPASRFQVSFRLTRFQKVRSVAPLMVAISLPLKRADFRPVLAPVLYAACRKPIYSHPRSGPSSRRWRRK